jgi:hypothetical protein
VLGSDTALDFTASGIHELYMANTGRNEAIVAFVQEALLVFPPPSFWAIVVSNLNSEEHFCVSSSCVLPFGDADDGLTALQAEADPWIRRIRGSVCPLYRMWEVAHNDGLPPRNWRSATRAGSFSRAIRGFAYQIPCSFADCLSYFDLKWWCRAHVRKSRARGGRLAEIIAASRLEPPELDWCFWGSDSIVGDENDDDRRFYHRGDTLKRRFSMNEVQSISSWAHYTDMYGLSRDEIARTLVDHFLKLSLNASWLLTRRPGGDCVEQFLV